MRYGPLWPCSPPGTKTRSGSRHPADDILRSGSLSGPTSQPRCAAAGAGAGRSTPHGPRRSTTQLSRADALLAVASVPLHHARQRRLEFDQLPIMSGSPRSRTIGTRSVPQPIPRGGATSRSRCLRCGDRPSSAPCRKLDSGGGHAPRRLPRPGTNVDEARRRDDVGQPAASTR